MLLPEGEILEYPGRGSGVLVLLLYSFLKLLVKLPGYLLVLFKLTALLSALLLGAADGRLLAALLAALPAASAVGTGALRRESRKDTPPTATQTTRVSPAMRRMARLRRRRRTSARVRRRRWMGCC